MCKYTVVDTNYTNWHEGGRHELHELARRWETRITRIDTKLTVIRRKWMTG